MANRTSAKVAGVLLLLAASCGRSPLVFPDAASGSAGLAVTGGRSSAAGAGGGGTIGSGGGAGAGGSGGVLGRGGSGGTVSVPPSDGGLPPLLGDGGLLNGILDARRDSLVGQVICGPEVRSGAPCSASALGCLLPSLGGACACLGGSYLCPANPNAQPVACPKGAQTGGSCNSPLSTCLGGGANACVCGLGTYTCF